MSDLWKKTWYGLSDMIVANEYVLLKDNRICRDCADELHVMYPVTFERNKLFRPSEFDGENLFSSSGGHAYDEYSDISELTMDQYKEKLKEVEAYRAKLRRQYDGYSKVFEVLSGNKNERLNPYKVGLPKMFKFKDTIKYEGRAIVGTWKKNDMVTLIHEGKEFRSKVLNAFPNEPIPGIHGFWFDGEGELREGYMGYIILEKGTPLPTPGDFIVADEY